MELEVSIWVVPPYFISQRMRKEFEYCKINWNQSNIDKTLEEINSKKVWAIRFIEYNSEEEYQLFLQRQIWPNSPPKLNIQQKQIISKIGEETQISTYFLNLPPGPWTNWNLVYVCRDHHPVPGGGGSFLMDDLHVYLKYKDEIKERTTFKEFYEDYGVLCVFNYYLSWILNKGWVQYDFRNFRRYSDDDMISIVTSGKGIYIPDY
jgi:hypothetical protein